MDLPVADGFVVTCTIRMLAKLKGFPVIEMIEIFEFKVDGLFC